MARLDCILPSSANLVDYADSFGIQLQRLGWFAVKVKVRIGVVPALITLLLFLAGGCGGAHTPTVTTPPPTPASPLTAADVQSVVQNAVTSVNTPLTVAVTDRGGNILAVFQKPGAGATATGNFGATVPATELAVALARTASYFSNDQAPLSSRTVRFV